MKEREFKNNRSNVYPASLIGNDLLLNPVDFDWSRGYLPIQGYYLQCSTCGDLVPMNPDIDIQCSCEAVAIYPSTKKVQLDPKQVTITKLIAKAKAIPEKKWWQVWR